MSLLVAERKMALTEEEEEESKAKQIKDLSYNYNKSLKTRRRIKRTPTNDKIEEASTFYPHR